MANPPTLQHKADPRRQPTSQRDRRQCTHDVRPRQKRLVVFRGRGIKRCSETGARTCQHFTAMLAHNAQRLDRDRDWLASDAVNKQCAGLLLRRHRASEAPEPRPYDSVGTSLHENHGRCHDARPFRTYIPTYLLGTGSQRKKRTTSTSHGKEDTSSLTWRRRCLSLAMARHAAQDQVGEHHNISSPSATPSL